MKMSFQNLLSVIENERINSREDSETETNLSSYSYPPSSPSLPSSPLSFGSNEDSESSESKKQARSLAHLASEKRRRANINDGFEMLRSVVPNCQPCHSKAEILNKAVQHIKQLSDQNKKNSPTIVENVKDMDNVESEKSSKNVEVTPQENIEESDIKKKLNFALKYVEKIKRQRDELQKQLDEFKSSMNFSNPCSVFISNNFEAPLTPPPGNFEPIRPENQSSFQPNFPFQMHFHPQTDSITNGTTQNITASTFILDVNNSPKIYPTPPENQPSVLPLSDSSPQKKRKLDPSPPKPKRKEMDFKEYSYPKEKLKKKKEPTIYTFQQKSFDNSSFQPPVQFSICS